MDDLGRAAAVEDGPLLTVVEARPCALLTTGRVESGARSRSGRVLG